MDLTKDSGSPLRTSILRIASNKGEWNRGSSPRPVFVTRGEPFERVERTGKKRDMNKSLMLFLQKHPDAEEEYGNPMTYLRHAFRMVLRICSPACFFSKAEASMYLLINSCAHPLRQSEFVSGVGRNEDERTFHNCPLKF